MHPVQKVIEPLRQKKKTIFGVGQLGQLFLHYLLADNQTIDYFIDETRAGDSYGDIPIRDLYDIVDDLDDLYILVGIGDYKPLEDVKQKLLSIGAREEQFVLPKDFFINLSANDVFDPIIAYDTEYELPGYKRYNEDLKGTNVIIYGGSTSDHAYTTHESWIEKCSRSFPPKTVILLNGAHRGYTSREEMFKCVRDLATLKPSIVISFTGINDCLLYSKINSSDGINWTSPSDYLNQLLNNLILSNSNYKKIGKGLEDILDIPLNWLNHMRTMHAVCQEFGAEFHAFVQPSLLMGHYQMSDFERRFMDFHLPFEFQKNMSCFFSNIIELSRSYPYIHNLTDIFAEKENMYIDYVHASEAGNEIIAQYMAEFIKKHI